MTTPRQVNRKLAKLYGCNAEGEPLVILQRSGAGYYYFRGDVGLFKITSIYSYNLHGWTTEEVLGHVARDLQSDR